MNINNQKLLIIMIGISGSGKTTYIKNNYTNAMICSADHYFYDENGVYNFSANKLYLAHKFCQNKAKQFLYENKPVVIIDNTNVSIKEIRTYLKLAEEYKYKIKFIKIDCSVSIAMDRNQHNTSKETIEKQFNKLKSLILPEEYEVLTISII